MSDQLEPGTEEAVDRGCTCQLRDGEPSDNDHWPDWMVAGCPIHDRDWVAVQTLGEGR